MVAQDSKLLIHESRCLHRAPDQVNIALAEVGAQTRRSSKVINDRCKTPKITHIRVEKGNHVIHVDGCALPEA
jgi:hypothetical protein